MNRTESIAVKFAVVLGYALLGCTAYGQPLVEVEVSAPLPTVVISGASVEIRTENDFYEPLARDGGWVVIGSYGRCWRPAHVASDWRPYCNGNWQRTEAGWYWVSDEPWAWATYHYGRWDFSDEYGWYWVPQTQWAPAWVSWHEGGGYIGWVPMQPSGARAIRPQAYVFVEERHFMEPVRGTTVVVNNTTIINQTVINQGPATSVIERASGQKVQAVAAQDLRQKQEAVVISRHRTPAMSGEKKNQTPVRGETGIPATKTVAPATARPIDKPTAITQEPAVSAPKNRDMPAEPRKAAPLGGVRAPEGNPLPTVKEPGRQNANIPPPKQVKQAHAPDKNPPSTGKVNPATGGKDEANPVDKDSENKGKQ